MAEIKLQVGVKVLLKNTEGKFLFLRRSLNKYPDIVGRWDIVGGRIDPGTTLYENLAREVKEETNLDLDPKITLIAAQDIMRGGVKHVVRLTYTGTAQGDITLDTSENDQYVWLSDEEMRKHDDIDMYVKKLLDEKLL